MENEDAFVWSSELPPMILDDAAKENKRESLLLGETRQARRESFMKNGALQKLAATYDNLQGIWQGEKAKREPHLKDNGAPPLPVVVPGPPLQSQDLNGQRQLMADVATVKMAHLPIAAPVLAPVIVHIPAAAPPPPRISSATSQHANSNSGGATGTLLQPMGSAVDGLLNSFNAPSFTASGGGGGSRHFAPSSSAGVPGASEPLFDFSSALSAHQHHNLSGGVSQVLRHAVEIYEERELADMCEEGLNKQLTRTKDGATEQSRIQELAAIVKTLRKCVREIAGRATIHVDHCVKIEKDLLKQIEGIQLQSESVARGLEAELAGVKKDLAQYEATFKMDKAKWGADLEDQKYEMMRLKRELDRVTEERDRAREESKKAEVFKQQLEAELKELKKLSNQQIREVSSNQTEVVQRLTEAAEKREAVLKEDRQRLIKRMEAAQSCIEALQGELAALQHVHSKAQDTLKTRVAVEETLSHQTTQLQADLDATRRQLEGASAKGEELSRQLSETKQAYALSDQAAQEHAESSRTLQEQVTSLEATLNTERAQWSEEREGFVVAHQEAAEREVMLLEEKTLLKTAVATALTQKESLEGRVAALSRDHQALAGESANLRNQVEFATGCQQQSEQEASELRGKLGALEAQMAVARDELEVKGSRLQDLEGEFSALKEVLGESGQVDVVNNLLRKISVLQNAVAASDAVRRKIHNELVEVKGNIRVYCRVKPYAMGGSTVKCTPDGCGLQIAVEGKDHALEFDRVYGPTSNQEMVFNGVSELVQSALDGYHVCLFSYGQTGAGKTFTMQGSDSPSGRGIIPRAVEKILQTASQLEDQEWEYNMEASFIEIYNNQLKDLLGGPSAPYISDQNAIKHDAAGGHTTVVGVSRMPIKDTSMAASLIQRASAARSCEATAMNSTSSRSHSIFMLYITGAHPPSGTQLQGCLCLVDLAGSERLDRSQAEGQRKAEACAINQSLSSIGDVFAALASKSSHVPYRNSKLTYLLQPCLGGHGKTLMFVNVNPEPASAYESLCSLRFAAKVNGCETAAKGGAKRYGSGGGASASAASDSGGDDSKRLSFPGFNRNSSVNSNDQQHLAADKRMSLIGTKRPAAPPVTSQPPSSALGGMPPLHGNAAKRIRPN